MSDSEMSVTIKHQGKDAPWLVFRGCVSSVLDMMEEAFVIPIGELTLHEYVVVCQQHVNGVSNVAKVLGGVPVADTGDAWASVTDPAHPLVAALAACNTQLEVKQLWAKNRQEFESNEVLEVAMKDRFKEVPEA